MLPSPVLKQLPSLALPELRTPEQAAAELVPRLAAHAALSDHEGGFPVEEIAWLREAGLLAAPLQAQWGGANGSATEQMEALLKTLKHVGRGNLAVGRVY